jgi:hypothetical protein
MQNTPSSRGASVCVCVCVCVCVYVCVCVCVQRYFVLLPEALFYYQGLDEYGNKETPLGSIDLNGIAAIREKEETRFDIVMRDSDRVFELRAENAQQRESWIAALSLSGSYAGKQNRSASSGSYTGKIEECEVQHVVLCCYRLVSCSTAS